MMLRSLLGQRRSGPKVGESKALESQTAEGTKILDRDVDAIISAREALLYDANTAHPCRIDASAFAVDRPASLRERVEERGGKKREASSTDAKVEGRKRKDLAKEQEAENRGDRGNGGGEETPRANDVCALERACEAKGRAREVEREARVERSARDGRPDESIGPTRLSEMINDSIKEAVHTIVKQCSMVSRMQVSTIFSVFLEFFMPTVLRG